MSHITKAVSLGLAAALCMATPASAALLDFTLTGATNASWQLDQQPVPDDSATGTAFELDGVAGNFGSGVTSADLTFYDAAYFGGLEIYDSLGGQSLVLANGPQLYTGDAAMPTFLTGTFALTDAGGTAGYTLTIGTAAAAVPEPATWALALVGFAAIGGMARRRPVALRIA